MDLEASSDRRKIPFGAFRVDYSLRYRADLSSIRPGVVRRSRRVTLSLAPATLVEFCTIFRPTVKSQNDDSEYS